MKYKIEKKWKPESDDAFIQIPNKALKLPPHEFKLYCWLQRHEVGFKFTIYYMKHGTGFHYQTLKEKINNLENLGMIEIKDGKITIINPDSINPDSIKDDGIRSE